MFNKKLFRILSLVFGSLALVGLVICLCTAITLPHTSISSTYWGRTTTHYSGSFNLVYLVPIILLFTLAFWGIANFFMVGNGNEEIDVNFTCDCDDDEKEDNASAEADVEQKKENEEETKTE